MKYETSGDRLKRRRKELRLTQRQLSKKVGVSAPSITQWELGNTNPRGESLNLLCKALNCSLDWLLYGYGDPEDKDQPVNLGPNLKDLYPIISWSQAAADNPIEEANKADADLYPCPAKCGANTFVLTVQGISMNPDFKNGDLIFVDPEKSAEHDSYVVIKNAGDNQAQFRRLVVDSGSMFLVPENPNWPEQFIKLDDSAKIIGVVVFSGRKYQP